MQYHGSCEMHNAFHRNLEENNSCERGREKNEESHGGGKKTLLRSVKVTVLDAWVRAHARTFLGSKTAVGGARGARAKSHLSWKKWWPHGIF